jgi:hypothetical protein
VLGNGNAFGRCARPTVEALEGRDQPDASFADLPTDLQTFDSNAYSADTSAFQAGADYAYGALTGDQNFLALGASQIQSVENDLQNVYSDDVQLAADRDPAGSFGFSSPNLSTYDRMQGDVGKLLQGGFGYVEGFLSGNSKQVQDSYKQMQDATSDYFNAINQSIQNLFNPPTDNGDNGDHGGF